MKKKHLSEWSDWIDGQDVMEKLHITPRALQRWRISGFLPFSRLKKRLYYRKSDILNLLRGNFNGEQPD
ncbi:MAG: helix-turn-helix domain-containing protein [Porphyromonadaceae bacterium]|nr:helix-turn-helix domain-containing protein [Porphyromonadaceae bacterium]